MKNKTKFTAVILAGGMGTRLGELTKNIPKSLVAVVGRPLIQYSLDWANFLGAQQTVVVGGYLFDSLRATVQKIGPTTVMIDFKDFATTGRLLGLLAARAEIRGGLFSFDGDYIYHRAVAEAMLPHLHGFTIFATREESADVQLDMRIKVDNRNQLLDMSKGTGKLADYPYYFNSAIYCGHEFLGDWFASANKVVQKIGPAKAQIEDALLEYVRGGGIVDVVDVGYPHWVEVDTPEELAVAERLVTSDPAGFIIDK